MLCILKAFFAWIGLTLVSINLIGLIVRGFFPPSLPVDGPTERVSELLRGQARRMYTGDFAMTLIIIALTCGLLFSLYHYWNVWLAVAAAMLMVGRLPDLIWEILHGRGGVKPQGIAYVVGFLLILSALPLVWYSLCRVSQ